VVYSHYQAETDIRLLIIRRMKVNYLENLQVAGIIFATTVFIMSWDYVPPIFNRIKNLTRG